MSAPASACPMLPAARRRRSLRLVGLVMAAAAGSWLVSPTLADHNHVYEMHKRGEILSLVKILSGAQAIQPGQMVEAELDEELLVYQITVYGEDDRYHEMHFDARDGRLLSENPAADDTGSQRRNGEYRRGHDK